MSEEAEYCEGHGRIGRSLRNTEVRSGVLACTTCGRTIECEFDNEDESPHAATELVVDYAVCGEHSGHAVNNISTRY